MKRIEESKEVYRPAWLLKDGTILHHPDALAHFQILTLNPKLNVNTFDFSSIIEVGGFDSHGFYHNMKWFSEEIIEKNMKRQEETWEQYSEGKETWSELIAQQRELLPVLT